MHIDSHNHTQFSIDSSMPIEVALAKAKEFDLKLVITEHCDTDEFASDGTYTDFDKDLYFATYGPYREAGEVLLGMEMGLDLEPFITKNYEIMQAHPFDQIIGSIHTMDGKAVSEWAETMTKSEFYHHYYEHAFKIIQAYPMIDIFAHIDYPSRYTHYEKNAVDYEEFPELFDQFLKLLIANDITLEINLRKLDDASFYHAYQTVLAAYKRLGGEFVSIGGDNHGPAQIGIKYHLGRALAAEFDLKPVYYVQRQRTLDL